MALEVRRIVTGHDSQGKAVVATDERLAGTGAVGRAGISRVDVWSTDKMPIDNSASKAQDLDLGRQSWPPSRSH